ncbi:MAG TPA: Fe-S cluster assembly protein SufD [Actinomycetota bacterium]
MGDILTEARFTRAAIPAPEGEPAWARRIRQQAFAAYQALPIPSQETEEWRYTDVSGLDLESFAPSAPGRVAETLDDVDPAILEALGAVGDRAGLLIQHNADTASAHLDPALAEQGVRFLSLDRAIAEVPDLVEPYLHAAVPADRTKLTALHAAFRTGGVFLHVPRDVRVEVPLQALTYLGADGAAIFPHALIVAEEGAEVTFIDRYVSPPLERALSDALVEIHLGRASRVRYVGLQDYGTGVTHLSVERALVGPDAQLRSFGVAFGASMARAEVEAMLIGDGGSSELLGVYFGDGDQHIDHRSIQDHSGSRTSSDLLYKGALRDRSAAIYTGTVIIEEGAHLCDAYQTNRNILLSEDARAHSVPNLEILTNDPTRCGHAASVGPVDEDELFYLQTRGISREEAERLIVAGFFREVLDRVDLEEVREGIQAAIEAELS